MSTTVSHGRRGSRGASSAPVLGHAVEALAAKRKADMTLVVAAVEWAEAALHPPARRQLPMDVADRPHLHRRARSDTATTPTLTQNGASCAAAERCGHSGTPGGVTHARRLGRFGRRYGSRASVELHPEPDDGAHHDEFHQPVTRMEGREFP